jgi:hypothetical protein
MVVSSSGPGNSPKVQGPAGGSLTDRTDDMAAAGQLLRSLFSFFFLLSQDPGVKVAGSPFGKAGRSCPQPAGTRPAFGLLCFSGNEQRLYASTDWLQ